MLGISKSAENGEPKVMSLHAFCKGLVCFLIVIASPFRLTAGDWAMWRYDAGHTAASPDDLPEELSLQWTRTYSPRTPVWDDPLNRDMMPYDQVFEPVVAGGRLFIGFNDSDKVVAIDVRDGSELWTFFADGPVRLSPVVYKDSLLFTSDDGYIYSLGAADGKLRWRFRGGPSERKAIGNGRVISCWPARGGPVVADDTVYFAASIWPFMGTFIYALEADTGTVRWINDGTGAEFQPQPHKAPAFGSVAPQGQLTVAGELLLVPGGRSLPAAFDRKSGKLEFFNFGGKGEGGSFVAADRSRAFVHTRVRGTMALRLPSGADTKFRTNEPVLGSIAVYAAGDAGQTPQVECYDSNNQRLWQVAADGSGDLIQAGHRLYAAGSGKITAITLPTENEHAKVAWSIPVDGDMRRLVAAAGTLFAVTLDGRILAYAEQRREPKTIGQKPEPNPPTREAVAEAKRILDVTGEMEGYAYWFGVDRGDLLAAVIASSRLRIVGVDSDAEKVERLRRRFDKAGLYGKRVTLHVGTAASYMAPVYTANLIVVGQSMVSEFADPQRLAQIYDSLRPYGGKLWIRTESQDTESFAITGLPKAKKHLVPNAVLISREGALPGAADWTHAYGDIANTVKSNDRRVTLPLGLLWFGGNSNLEVLPRHGHGPSEQVINGRLFIEGMNGLSARDVYTGRVLWKREFSESDLGIDDVYFDETYADTPLSTQYNQVHLPGANARGTNYVATDEGVYLALRDRCVLLDAATGKTLRQFKLPVGEDGETPSWGYIGVYKNLLLAGVGFADYSERLGYKYTPEKKRGPAWSPDHSGSLALSAFDRYSGEVLWTVQAQHSFLHNGIVAGGGRVYLLDRLPKRVEEQIKRRGATTASTYRLHVIDAQSGRPIWTSHDDIFGTWLGYSAEHDVLLEAGAAAVDRSPDESDRGIAVYRADTGKVLWKNLDMTYAGPCILHGDTIITNTTSYHESQGAYRLLDGSPITIKNPVTGEDTPWRFTRTYGCNTAVASENLLTFRSGAAGFYDLINHSGTGNFGGFKSGCSSNLIAANGVLNAPDYTRTCTCGYQNQTSLALVPMSQNEFWTYNLFGEQCQTPSPIRRIGINLGAPGDRLSEEGTLWVNYPADTGSSPRIGVRIEGNVKWFRGHSSRVSGQELPWVAASGTDGIQRITVSLNLHSGNDQGIAFPVVDPQDDAEESDSGKVDLRSSDLELIRERTKQTVGLRFQNVSLNRGTKIKRAFIQFEVDEVSEIPTVLEIRGQAADNAAVFSTQERDITTRPVTDAAAVWKPKPWAKKASRGPDQQTSDLTPVIQEIVNRRGWKPGNALAVVIRGTGKRVAVSRDGGAKKAAQLIVETEAGSSTEGDSSASSTHSGEVKPPRYFTVRLVFAEPHKSVKPGDRVFDVAMQGKTTLEGFDIVAQANAVRRPVVRTWSGIPASKVIEIAFHPRTDRQPVLCGVEIIEEQRSR